MILDYGGHHGRRENGRNGLDFDDRNGRNVLTTICIGIFIQPAWNFEEAKAFGEEGSTEAKNIIFELMMILLFTALVIWLARKGLQAAIKYFILFALWVSMLYATVPIFALIGGLSGLEDQEPWRFAFMLHQSFPYYP